MKLLFEGKTKKIWKIADDNLLITNKDVLTYGDGKYIYPLKGIGVLKQKQVIETDKIIHNIGIPTAICDYNNTIGYIIEETTPIPVEFVFRNEYTGSYCKRNPDVKEGTIPENAPMIEMFIKDAIVLTQEGDLLLVSEKESMNSIYKKRWTDPLVVIRKNGKWNIHPNKEPYIPNNKLMTIDPLLTPEQINECIKYTRTSAEALTDRLSDNGVRLIDGKLEYGIDKEGKIIMIETPTLDEVRIELADGTQTSKQVFRDIIEGYIKDVIKESVSESGIFAKEEEKDVTAEEVFAKFTEEDDKKLIAVYEKGVKLLSKKQPKLLVHKPSQINKDEPKV